MSGTRPPSAPSGDDDRRQVASNVPKRTPTVGDRIWGIGCAVLAVVIILVFLYYLTGGDLFIVGVAVVIGLIVGLIGLVTGRPINN